jgi:membrane fusion protein (multidrug efflux system)
MPNTPTPGGEEPTPSPKPPARPAHKPASKQWIVFGVIAVAIIAIVIASWGYIERALNTVSTDDGYVNGHVTFVAPRVPGQVITVFVDDNNRVHKGDLLVQLDPEPYQVQVNIAQADVDAAQADAIAATATVRGEEALARSNRFKLDHVIEEVRDQVAQLHAKIATVDSAKAELTRAQADYDRAFPLLSSGAVTKEEVDRREQVLLVSKAQVQEALQEVYQIRVSLGLSAEAKDGNLADVPDDLDQTFSSVRQATAELAQSAAALGVINQSLNQTPQQMINQFYDRDPQHNIDTIYEKLMTEAPLIKQSQAKLMVAQRNLDQAKLNLRYCNVYAEIDGVVTRRNVNPGDNVIAGQSLMAVRSLTEIWIDANFKETQLGDLRIGQSADLDVDMYGSHQHFKGRISGFEMGTGSTLALLPPENATGNYVKVVQRLPVRIDLVDYDPEKSPLFVGLSVTPYVDIVQAPTGPNAGDFLQPFVTTTTQPATAEGKASAQEANP